MSLLPLIHELEPEVKLETFEDLTTVRRVVGDVRGFDDPITTELRSGIEHSFGDRVEPMAYAGDEAKTIVRALKVVAKSREDELALSAAETLKRIPLRLKAATFITDLISKPEVPEPSTAHKARGYPLYDPSMKRRPPIEYKSKYDQSIPENRAS